MTLFLCIHTCVFMCACGVRACARVRVCVCKSHLLVVHINIYICEVIEYFIILTFYRINDI